MTLAIRGNQRGRTHGPRCQQKGDFGSFRSTDQRRKSGKGEQGRPGDAVCKTEGRDDNSGPIAT